LEAQDKVGQYTLVRKIGEGGMAEVWEARHDQLGSRAAIKFLLPDFARNKDLQERFLNEGKRQAQLQHPNIIPAMDFFQVEGRSFLVMQYVEGENLENRLKKENPPLTLDEVRSIARDILSALEYAHSKGVVHRDIKPSNMLLDPNGRVLLMDFGIALALTEEQRLTRTNTSMGTPDYMSPEQITRPLDVDFRSDIYSFGCVLYAMLSGNPPFSFEGATAFAIHDRHVRAAPPPLVFRNPEIPRGVANVVVKCLEKDPANRYQTCGEIIPALEAALDGKSISSRGSKKYAVAGLVAIVLVAAGAYSLKFFKPKPDVNSPDWTQVQWDYAFPDCNGDKPCIQKKDQAAALSKIKNWKDIRFDDPVLKDCMYLPVCLERKSQAQSLVAVGDWKKITDKKLLDDCMSDLPCELRRKEIASVPSAPESCEYIAEHVECCRLEADPARRARCIACKKEQQVFGSDCRGNYQLPR
jgi:serine/threonine protein kinase